MGNSPDGTSRTIWAKACYSYYNRAHARPQRKTIARKLERKLFEAGRSAYFLGMGNLLYGVAAEIKTPGIVPERGEHIRRLGEVANIMLDAGLILIVTAAELLPQAT